MAKPAPLPASARSAPFWPTWLPCALIFVATCVVYRPAWYGGMLWDDGGHVTRPELRSLSGLGRIWFEIGATQQYYPVLHSAFWVEHRLWGDSVLGYHWLNIALHATAACLFAAVLRRIFAIGSSSDPSDPGRAGTPLPASSGRSPPEARRGAESAPYPAGPGGPAPHRTAAWIAAGLFALHPVCVESVAWISEQKNTLSAVFYLGAALAYLRFETSRNVGNAARARFYTIASGLFLLALLTKTVTATLPAALLVVFWWRRGRLSWRHDVVPLLPWFALGAAGGLFTAHFERELIGAQGADFSLGALERGLLAGRVFWFYLGKVLWPANLVFIYPRWTVDAADIVQWLYPVGAVALVAGLGVGAARAAGVWRDRARALLAALLLFGGTLFPVLGFFNVFPFLYSYVADHFQYLAALPIYAIVAYGAAAWIGAYPRTIAVGGLGRAGTPFPASIGPENRRGAESTLYRLAAVAIVLGALGVLTWRQARLYRDPVTLYEATLARNPTCWMAHNNLAIEFAAAGRVTDAVPHLETAVRLKPDFAPAENNLGDDLVRLGRVAEAIPHFERALLLQPNYAVAHRNLGMALAMSNRVDDAVAHFTRATQLDPNYAEAELDLAVALDQTRQFAAARPHFERAIALAPSSIDPRLAYAEALATHGDLDAAIRHYRVAVELAPASTEAQQGLAAALRRAGRTE